MFGSKKPDASPFQGYPQLFVRFTGTCLYNWMENAIGAKFLLGLISTTLSSPILGLELAAGNCV